MTTRTDRRDPALLAYLGDGRIGERPGPRLDRPRDGWAVAEYGRPAAHWFDLARDRGRPRGRRLCDGKIVAAAELFEPGNLRSCRRCRLAILKGAGAQ